MPLGSRTRDDSPLDTGISPGEVVVQGGIGDSGMGQFGSGVYDFSKMGGMVTDPNSLSNPSPFDVNSVSPNFNFGSSSAGSSGSSLLQNAIGTLTGGKGLGGLAAIGGEAAAAAYGLSEAKKAQQQSQAQAQKVMDASQPFLDAAKGQLAQFTSQHLNPQQQSFVDFTTKEGQDVIDSGNGLKAIAQQAFGDYASGKLPAADQLALDQKVAAQKQQVAQQMAASGTTDSSILAGYNQQIDMQATIAKQQLLDARFATGNQAYNSWLNTTEQGTKIKALGAEFAQQSFQSMMNNSLGLAGVGMSGLTTAIGLEIQSDEELSKQVSDLMGNLASAYAYTVSGPGNAGGGGGGGGQGGGGAAAGGGLVGGLVSTAVGRTENALITKGLSAALGGGGAAGGASGGGLAGVTGSLNSGLDGVASSAAGSVGGGAAAGAGAAAAGAAVPGGLAASGSFATGGGAAAASGAGAGGGAALGAAGTAAAVAAPFAFLAAGLSIGDAWTSNNEVGNRAMSAWMKATGAKVVSRKGSTNVGQSTFGSKGQFENASKPKYVIMPNGQKVNEATASNMMIQWAMDNGIPIGDIKKLPSGDPRLSAPIPDYEIQQ